MKQLSIFELTTNSDETNVVIRSSKPARVKKPVDASQIAAFAEFWRLYPRKASRKYAEQCWCKLTPKNQEAALAAIPAHADYWKRADRPYEMIPHASTWLNQARWEDELPAEAEVSKPKVITPGWWTTEGATIAQGAHFGLAPRPGESLADFRDRVRARLDVRAPIVRKDGESATDFAERVRAQLEARTPKLRLC